MTEPTKALPCPFCGSSNVVHYEVEGSDNHHFECCECLSSSMCKTTYQEALAAWNRRTPQPTQAQAGAVPLTDEQIETVTGAKIGTPLFLAAKGFVLATEAAHGIKGADHG